MYLELRFGPGLEVGGAPGVFVSKALSCRKTAFVRAIAAEGFMSRAMLRITKSTSDFGRIAALVFGLPAFSLAQQIAVGYYAVPTANSGALGIAAGPDGALWFAEYAGNKIGRITTSGDFTEYALPNANSGPWWIAAGPDGALWFTESTGNRIGHISTAGTITEYPIPTADSSPVGIVTGPDGALWFTESGYHVNKIGRITTAGAITEYPVSAGPAGPGTPWGIITGPDRALWFTEFFGGPGIGRITLDGAITLHLAPWGPTDGITLGPDGAIWFTNWANSAISRMTLDGVVTGNYLTPEADSYPNAIVTGPDGALWFTEVSNSQIGRITTSGIMTQYAGGGGWGIAAGPDGALWFTDHSEIGEIVFTTADLSVSPADGYYKSDLTFSGSGFAPNENIEIYASGVGSAVLVGAIADSTGSFTAAARAPQSAYGQRLFLGVGQSSGKLGAASYSMAPRLVLNPGSGPVGSVATVEGYGFGSFETVNVYWNSPRKLLGSATADVHGSFTGAAGLTFTVPAGALTGKNGVFAVSPIDAGPPLGPGSFIVQ
jgi:virginiamycin B lyase